MEQLDAGAQQGNELAVTGHQHSKPCPDKVKQSPLCSLSRLVLADSKRGPPTGEVESQREPLTDEVDSQREPLTDDLDSQREPLKDEVEAHREPLTDEVEAQREPLTDDFDLQREPLKDEVEAHREPLTDEVEAQREPLTNEVEAHRVPLTDDLDSQWEPLKDEVEAHREPLTDEVESQREPLKDEVEAQREPLTDDLDSQREPLTDEVEAQREPLTEEVELQRVPLTDDLDSQREPLTDGSKSQGESPTHADLQLTDIPDSQRELISEKSTPTQNPAAEQTAAAESSAPDGGWGWMVVLGATVAHFFLVGFARCLGVVYQVLRERFDSNSAETAWIASGFNTARTITAPLCSLLCDRFGCRPVAVIGGFLFGAGLFASAFATSLVHLFFSFCLLAGLGGVMVFTSAYIMLGQYFDKRKGKAMGLATIGSGLGNVVLGPLINMLFAHYGFFGAMLILGSLVLNTCAGGALYRPLRQRPGASVTEKEVKLDVEAVETVKEMAPAPAGPAKSRCCHKLCSSSCMCSAEIWSNRAFLAYCLLMAGMQYAIMGMLVFVTGYAVELGASNANAALLLSIYGFVDMIARFGYAFLFDIKLFRKRRRYPYAVLGLLFGTSTIMIGLVKSYVALAVVVAVNALFEAGFHSQRATILSELVPKSQMSMAVGLMIAFQGVGNLTGPPVAGFFRDMTGSHSVCFFFGGGVFTLTALVFTIVMLKQSGALRRCSHRHSPTESSVTECTHM